MMSKYKCTICGYIYDEAAGIPEKGIAPGTKFEALPEDFICPVCTAPKSAFELVEVKPDIPVAQTEATHAENLRELSPGELSAICSSLAKGCEKQRLTAEMEAFFKLADYFKAKTPQENGYELTDIKDMAAEDLKTKFASANAAAKEAGDRGALRSLVWAEKVTTMAKLLVERYEKEGDAMLENTRIFVCDICGFIYLGNTPPEVCPVCKVPNFKIIEVERR